MGPRGRDEPASNGRITPALGVGLVLASASGYPIGTIGVGAASPFLLTAMRIVLAALLLGAFAVVVRAHWPRRRLLVHTVVVGLLIHGVHFTGLYAGLAAGVPAGVSALVFGLNPLLTGALVTLALGERLGRMRVVGLVIGVIAVLCALGDRLVAAGGVDAGSALTIFGLLGLAAGSVWQQRFCGGVDVRAAAAVQLAAAALPLALLAAIVPATVDDATSAGLVLLWLVLVNSIAGTMLLLVAVRRGGAARTATLFSVVPSVAALMSWPILGEVPSTGAVVGLVLGAVACVIGTRPADVSGLGYPQPRGV